MGPAMTQWLKLHVIELYNNNQTLILCQHVTEHKYKPKKRDYYMKASYIRGKEKLVDS
jgi:hypothetical protein